MKRVKFGVSRHFGRALWIFLIMVTLWLKLVTFGVSGHYLENVWEKMSRGGRRHISNALRRVLSSQNRMHKTTTVKMHVLFIASQVFQFLPEASFGLWVLSLPACVCVSVCPSIMSLSAR